MLSDNKRAAPRFFRAESVSIEILHPGLDASDSPEVIITETIDVSRAGLRVLVNEYVEAGRFFDTCVDLADGARRYLLTCETRWCRFNEQIQSYELGIAIQDGEGTDYLEWSRLFPEDDE